MNKIVFGILTILSFEMSAQDIKSVMTKYFIACGGVDLLEKLETSHTIYKYYDVYGRNDTTQIEVFTKVPIFQHTKSRSLKGELNYEVFNNETGISFYWAKPFPSEMFKTETQIFVVSSSQKLFNEYKNKTLKFIKEDTILRRKCYLIRTSYKNDQPNQSYYFDTQNGQLIAKKSDQLPTNILVFEDFRKTESGLVVPFVERTLYSYREISKNEYSLVQFNLSLNKADFDYKPEKRKALRNFQSPYNKVEILSNAIQIQSLDELLKDFAGKKILIDLWATWCGPCKAEITKYDDDFYKFLADNQIEMLFVSIDKPDVERKWKQDIDWFNMNGCHVLANKQLTKSIQEEIYGKKPLTIPQYIVVNEYGKILSTNFIRPSSATFRSELIKIFEK